MYYSKAHMMIKSRNVLKLIFCFILPFILASFQAAGKDEVYSKILEEYDSMVHDLLVSDGAMGRCKNACHEKTKNDRSVDGCYCDEECTLFRDCCLDYWKSCNTSFANAYKQPGLSKCLEPILIPANGSKPETRLKVGYEVIARCPLPYQNVILKDACEVPPQKDVESLLFVEGEDGRTYRNQHCADCHGVSKWKTWRTALNCPSDTRALLNESIVNGNFTFSEYERRTIRETCDLSMKPVNNSRTTVCSMTVQCENKSSPHFQPCYGYNLLLYKWNPDALPIKNPHCARCSNIDLKTLMTINFFPRGSGDTQSLAILFDFSKASEIYGLSKPRMCMEEPEFIHKPTDIRNSTCDLENTTFPNKSDHIILFKNHSVFVVAQNRLYNPSQYRWNGGNVTVFTCVRTSDESLSSVVLYSSIEFYITLVGFSLSSFALMAVLITYFLFEELRTVPGKIIMNLAVALLLSQLVFLTDTVVDLPDTICSVIAVMLHYLFLASFCWMNAIAVDVARTFGRKSHRFVGGTRRRLFIMCLIYAWGLPLIIVGITLTVDHSASLDVGYGNEHYCWITNPIALAVFFAVPVVTMILLNIVALIKILLTLRRDREITKAVRDQSSANLDTRMCWKLTVLFGLTWIFGLGASYHIVLRVVYIVSNSLQGVLIMEGFIMTRRVLNLYLKKAGRRPLANRSFPRRSTNTNALRKISTTISAESRTTGNEAKAQEPLKDKAINMEPLQARIVPLTEVPRVSV